MYLPPGPQPFGNSEVSHRSTPPPKNRASPLSNNNPPYQNLPQWGLSPAYPPSVATLPDSENVPPPGGYPGQNRQTGLRRSSSPGNAALQPVPPPSHNIPDNQERIPENRERLDNTEDVRQQLGTLSLNQQAESNDVQQHCSVDRNQYLETGQLSNLNNMAAGSANIEITDEGDAPPPGLHRLVTGQGCENQEQLVENQMSSFSQPEPSAHHDSTRHSTPLSSIEEPESVGEEPPPPREVPGQDQPLHNRVVLGQMGDIGRERERDRDSDRMERMVVGEMRSKQPQNSSSAQDDYNRQQHRGRPRHRRESSYEEEERDYSTDREKRHEDYRRRDERPRRRREHRSPEYRSDEEYDERRGYSRRERRSHERDYSPEYYRDYYRDRRPRRHMDHYSREYDDYYYRENRSRPSSRTGSDYRRSNVDYQQRHPWQPFYPDSTAISSGTYMDYNMSQRALKDYCEAFRRTDPINYRIWYNQQILRYNVTQPASYSNDRASVHSGQSSSDQRQNDMTHTDGVAPVDDTGVEDFTPRLYPAPHIRGKLDSQGRLVIVNPNDPMDGQRPSVQICKVNRTCWDPDIAEFLECPGPFISGVTHRNTVLQYLKKMSERSTGDSEKLLYDLVHLTVKGNGVVNGSDVAELLMDSYKLSSQEDKESNFDNDLPQISETEIISRFRGLLQQGNKTEALEWAMDHKVWGHALFLASKMDDRTHKAVMLRFANSIPHNDPLQTLYQLMSSNVPQASTYCADNNWSDWRPHLAMILSNPTANTELDRKAIITLGDSLGAGDRIFASHFCYLTAQVRFSSFKPGAKLVLLGSSTNQEFHKFATCRAIMLSLCYEYGLKLYNPLNSVPTFQTYKLLLATRLIDHDRNQSALQYCELLAREMSQPCHYDAATAVTVIDIAMRLKTFDPQVALSSDPDKEPEWLTSLKQVHEHAPVRKDVSRFKGKYIGNVVANIEESIWHL
ncbi:hypothetical protein AAG570_011182 [Ranatra chinensis]|uniref:Sec16 Sec23-binding domain-containing protein n=1 Tax=Ranatra chinensis TaxID=642074 RepID=A0ABD0YK06_9HEMI